MVARITWLLLVLGAAPALAGSYLPLDVGRFWSYVAEDGTEELKVVGEPVPLFGSDVFPLDHPISDMNLGLVNYWTGGQDSEVLLWGFFRDGWGRLYDPPIVMVDPPLVVGKVWSATFDSYALPDTIYAGTFTVSFQVYEDPVLILPGGSFETFGVGAVESVLGVLGGRSLTLAGEVASADKGAAGSWYASGVGEVQYGTDRLYQLQTWTDHPVTAEPVAWGAIKALYRGAD